MTNKQKSSKAWELLYEIREERNSPPDNFDDDPISNNLFHAICCIRSAYEDLEKE